MQLAKNLIQGKQDESAIFGNEQDIAKYLQKTKVLEQVTINYIEAALALKSTIKKE